MSAFSNGYEWDNWRANWCDTCVNDANNDCPIILAILMDENPKQIVRKDGADYTKTICTSWSDTVDSGPKPVEKIPGQLEMEFE